MLSAQSSAGEAAELISCQCASEQVRRDARAIDRTITSATFTARILAAALCEKKEPLCGIV